MTHLPGMPFSWDPLPAMLPCGASLSLFTFAAPWGPDSSASAAWTLLSVPHSNLPASLRTVPGAEAEPPWAGTPGVGRRGRVCEPEGLGGGIGDRGAGSGVTERLDTGLGVLEGESGEVWESRLALEADGGKRAGGLREEAGGVPVDGCAHWGWCIIGGEGRFLGR